MADRTGWLSGRVVAWMLAGVVFAQRCVDNLRDAEQRGTVVYVMRHRSLLDYLYFNVSFQRHGLRPVRFANGVNTWIIRPLLKAIPRLLRGRKGLPPDPECARALTAAGESTLLFLERGRRADHSDPAEALPFIEGLILQQQRQSAPILMMPTLLVWEKRPERARPSLLEGVFGTRQAPGFFKKAWYVLQNFWQAFLHIGAPTVQISSAIDLRQFCADRPDAPAARIALELLDHLHQVLEREQRVIVGPWVKGARQMIDEILADPRTRAELTGIEITAETERSELIARSRSILREIAADFSLIAIKFFSATLTPIWNQIYSGIDVDHEGLERVRQLATRHRIVLVPSHKSHIDYLVLSYVFYQNGLIPPHIAAGVNLSFWPLGPIFRHSGAFFLRRSFSDDPLYRALFNAYLVKLLEEGFAIEFFIEGTRSRTGKLNAPRYGMLHMIVDAFQSGDVDSLAFVPVSVGYEKVIEGATYQRELEGEEKSSEGLGDLLRAPAVLTSRYGRVHVEFGEPIDLGGFLLDHQPAGAQQPPRPTSEAMARTVRRLAYGIIHGINRVTTVTPTALAAMALLHQRSHPTGTTQLLDAARFLADLLVERDARLSRSLRDALLDVGPTADARPPDGPDRLAATLDEALQLLAGDRLVRCTTSDSGDSAWAPAPGRRMELAYASNSIVHYLVPSAIVATALALDCASPCTPPRTLPSAAPISRDTLQTRVHFLSRLLKFEFCFEERQRFPIVLDNTLRRFEQRRWVQRDGEDWIPVAPAADPHYALLPALLQPVLAAYLLAAEAMLSLADSPSDARQVVKHALQIGRARIREGQPLPPEALSRATIETALRLLREWDLVETRHQRRARRTVRELSVSDPDRVRMLRDLAGCLREILGLPCTVD